MFGCPSKCYSHSLKHFGGETRGRQEQRRTNMVCASFVHFVAAWQKHRIYFFLCLASCLQRALLLGLTAVTSLYSWLKMVFWSHKRTNWEGDVLCQAIVSYIRIYYSVFFVRRAVGSVFTSISSYCRQNLVSACQTSDHRNASKLSIMRVCSLGCFLYHPILSRIFPLHFTFLLYFMSNIHSYFFILSLLYWYFSHFLTFFWNFMSAHFQYLINYLINVIFACSGTLISSFPPHFPAAS